MLIDISDPDPVPINLAARKPCSTCPLDVIDLVNEGLKHRFPPH